MKKIINLLFNNKYLLLTGIGLISSILTFLFFYYSNSLLFKFEPKKEKVDIYEIAKEEAIKLGRIESDKEVPKVDADGKVIVPSLIYHDIGGMGPNSNKSFVSNISGSNNYLSMEISFSSYEGEKLGEFLKEYDPNFRNLIMIEIEKRKTDDFLGSKNRSKFLDDITDSMNQFLISKEEEPIIFNAVMKTFVIKQG